MNIFKLLRVLSVISIVFLYSCEPISDCKSCEAVTYDVNDGHEIERQSAIEYCGPALDEKENSQPYIDGNEKTVWECR